MKECTNEQKNMRERTNERTNELASERMRTDRSEETILRLKLVAISCEPLATVPPSTNTKE